MALFKLYDRYIFFKKQHYGLLLSGKRSKYTFPYYSLGTVYKTNIRRLKGKERKADWLGTLLGIEEKNTVVNCLDVFVYFATNTPDQILEKPEEIWKCQWV